MLHQIKAQQSYTDLRLSIVLSPTEIVEFNDFLRLQSDFPVLFKADLIFKDYSRNLSKFSSLCEPCDSSLYSLPFDICKMLVVFET